MSKMKIVITGAGGRFCQVLIPKLLDEGYEVIATDVVQLTYPCTCVSVSVTDFPTLRTAMSGADLVIHAAGLHDQLPRSPERPDAYDICYQVNVTGTHNVFVAALQAAVKKVIFISSMDYYAPGTGYLDENWPAARPAGHYYALSKVLAEDLCRYYAYNHNMRVISLRPGNFTGNPPPGLDFLDNRLRREDVARAVYNTITYESDEPFEAFNILAGNPFSSEDLEDLIQNPFMVLDRYYPGIERVLKKQGVEWKGLQRIPSIDRARNKLKYQPEFTFESYLQELKLKES